MAPLASRLIGVTIARLAAAVYDWLAEPANWPLWASGLGEGLVRAEGGWTARTPDGPVRIRFAARNGEGLLDHHVELASGETVEVPMRVIANGEGADVVLTLFRQPAMSDADYERDAAWVRQDLDRLKVILERDFDGGRRQ